MSIMLSMPHSLSPKCSGTPAKALVASTSKRNRDESRFICIGTLFESAIRVNLSSPARLCKVLDTGIRKSLGNGRAAPVLLLYTRLAYRENLPYHLIVKAVFVELPPFECYRADYFDDDAFSKASAIADAEPEAGDVISGTGGLRKLRFADEDVEKANAVSASDLLLVGQWFAVLAVYRFRQR